MSSSSLRRIVAFVLAALALAACNKADEPAVPMPTASRTMSSVPETKVVTVIGDSYTYGTDEGGLGQHGWPALTWARLRKNGTEVAAKVAAEGGAGYVTPGLQNHSFGQLAARAVQPHDDLVVYFGSLNDAADSGFDAQAATMAVHGTFAETRATAPEAKILVIGPAWPSADIPPHAATLRDVLSREASLIGATFVDPLADGWLRNDPGLIGSDQIHPNNLGHQYLADKIEPLIAAQLR